MNEQLRMIHETLKRIEAALNSLSFAGGYAKARKRTEDRRQKKGKKEKCQTESSVKRY